MHSTRDRVRAITVELLESLFAPAPTLTISEWADEHFQLPPTAAEKGRFRVGRLPYLKKILDTLGDERVRDVVFAKSSQVGGSTVGEIFIAYRIAHQPRAICSIWPTEKKADDWSRLRLEPMLTDVDVVAAKFIRTGRRMASDTMSRKEFPGGWLRILTSKSTSDLKSLSAPDIIYEELDEWEGDLDKQGDPALLAERANRTFPHRKNYKVSTPTLFGSSRIWAELEASTWNEYWVPCPHCRELQTLRWRDGDEDPDAPGAYRLIWEKDAGGEVIPGTTCYACAHCGALIEEHWKTWMLDPANGADYRPRHPGRYTEGFHINTLYSPLVPWDDVARMFTKAKRSPKDMKVFVNSWLGLPYREQGQKHLDQHYLALRAEDFGDVIPHGVGILVAGVDVQGAGGGWLDCHLWGFGADEESWVLEWEQLEGDPGRDEVWQKLEAWRTTPRRHASGALMRIAAMCVDANYQPVPAHRYCDPRLGQNVVPIIGRAGIGRKLIQKPKQQKFRKGTNYFPSHIVGRDAGLAMLYARLGIAQAGPEYVHFSKDLEGNYFEQLTAYRMHTGYVKGVPVREYVQLEGRRTEGAHGAVYAHAALAYLGPSVIRTLGARAKQLSEYRGPAGSPGGPAPRGGLVSEVSW
jgi:phage terminase large subunit GpA-like protein